MDEIAGSGNHYTAEFWEYDPRGGRRWNPDPVRVAWESPYAAFRNNPILYNDPDGDCPDCPLDEEGGKPTASAQEIQLSGNASSSIPNPIAQQNSLGNIQFRGSFGTATQSSYLYPYCQWQ